MENFKKTTDSSKSSIFSLLLTILFFLIFSFAPEVIGVADAAQCTNNVCITVHTDPSTGKIIIDARKVIPGSTPLPLPSAPKIAKPTPRLSSKPPVKPPVKRTVNPTPRPYVRHVPYIYHPHILRTPKPKPARTLSTPAPIAEVNLADQITQLLPTRHIYIEPESGVITQVPTYFWSDTPDIYSTMSSILAVAVAIDLRPTFYWDFGDGATLVTEDPGKPLPDTTVAHTYRRAGSYLVSLKVSWLGSWKAGNYSYPVLGGAILQSYQTLLQVQSAPTRFGE